jgi:DUF917 family protein
MVGSMRISETWLEDTVWGGALLGGGGGGSVAEGLAIGRTTFAVGRPLLVHPEDHPPDGTVVCCGLAVAPRPTRPFLLPGHQVRVVELLREHLSGELTGLIAEGMGGRAILDGWYASVVLDLPVLDLPADGRGHPLPLQGTLGLTGDPAYISWQACAGGDPDRGEYLEMYVSGSLVAADKLARRAAAQAGGTVFVARNPVRLERALIGGVVGGLHQAQGLGRDYRQQLGAGIHEATAWLADRMQGNLHGEFVVGSQRTNYISGLDLTVVEASPYRLLAAGTVLTVEREGQLLTRFPDLVILLDVLNGMPLTVSELTEGRTALLITIPADSLRMGAGSRDPQLLVTLEELTGRRMTI